MSLLSTFQILGEIDCCWFGLKLALSILNVFMGNLQQQRLVCEILVLFFLSWSRWTGNRPDHYALVIDLPSTIFKNDSDPCISGTTNFFESGLPCLIFFLCFVVVRAAR
jgi:hypothetical protein